MRQPRRAKVSQVWQEATECLLGLGLPLESTVPSPEVFSRPSDLHGQSHVGRVMIHAAVLTVLTGSHALFPKLWAAVYLHDLARKHDGPCSVHGLLAVKRLGCCKGLQDLLRRAGVADWQLPEIRTAVVSHCQPRELEPDHPHARLTSLLKDADALDRVRCGGLDVGMLRSSISRSLVVFAETLFRCTQTAIGPGGDHFCLVYAEAERIWQRTAPRLDALSRRPEVEWFR